MNVSILTASVSRRAGGLYHSVRQLAIEASRQSGVGALQVHGVIDNFSEEDLGGWGAVKVGLHRAVGPRAFGYAPGMRRALERSRPDVVHTQGLWMYPSVAAVRSGSRWVVSPRGMLSARALGFSERKKALARWLYEDAHLKGASCLHALREREAEEIREFGLNGPIAVLPNGVDLLGSSRQTIQRDTANRAMKDGVPVRVCLYLGRIHPIKGLSQLIRQWSNLRRPDWKLVIAGWDQGGHEAELKRMGVTGVEFRGAVYGEEKEQLLQEASAFVLPSRSEGCPMAVLEAWAAGLPVAMTEECNLVAGFEAGAAVKITGECEGLGTLLAMDDGELNHMGEAGRNLILRSFAWSHIARQMVEVYRWVAGLGDRPDCVRQI